MKKLLITLSIAIATTYSSYAQWLPKTAGSGDPLTGNLFINKVTPGIILEGSGYGNSGAYLNMQGWAGTNKNWQVGVANIGYDGLMFTPSTSAGGSTFTTPAMIINSIGEVGIGTALPTRLLDVNGTAIFGTVTSGSTSRTLIDGAAGSRVAQYNTSGVLTNFFQSDGVNYLNGGNVGIGTTSPAIGLHVEKDNGNGWATLFRTSSSYTGLLIGSQSSNYIRLVAISNDLGSYKDIAINPSGGNVGIGTTNPGVKLDVNGEIASNTAIYLHKNGSNTVNGALYLDNVTGTRAWNYQLDGSNGLALWNYNGSAWNSRLTVDINGNVGIGTTGPDQKLTVKGKIHSSEVIVDAMTTVPDYVFEPDYKLTGLDELKAYVDKNHHLPEIPSAKEIEKNGISLGDMNMKLLKKVEELTLYLIEKDSKDKVKEAQLQSQQKQIDDLKKQLSAISKTFEL